jgi:hypothetical protein
MPWWGWLIAGAGAWCAVSALIGVMFGRSIRIADRGRKHVDTDELCVVTELPKSWCQHCKQADPVRRHQSVLEPRRRGTQPDDIT